MSELAASHHIDRDPVHPEMHFSVCGFFTPDYAKGFLKELAIKTMPLIDRRIPFSVMGDMTGFVPQTREVGEAIRDQLVQAKQVGLKRVAIVGASALMKLQYGRLADGIEVQFFDTKLAAQNWLRSEAKAA